MDLKSFTTGALEAIILDDAVPCAVRLLMVEAFLYRTGGVYTAPTQWPTKPLVMAAD